MDIRRRRYVLAGAALGAVALVGTLVVAVSGDGDGPSGPPVTAPGQAAACDAPAEIRPVVLEGAPDAWSDLELPAERRCFTLTATKRDAAGVAADSAFLLEAPEPIPAAEVAGVAGRLVVEPALALEARAEGKGVRVEPARSLEAGTVYRFTLLDRPGGRPVDRWSFQSQAALRVVQTLPADQATGVPVDTGIELTFSHDGVDGVADRLEILPRVEGRIEIHKRTVVFVPRSLRASTLYTVTLQPGVNLAGSSQSITEPVTFRFETGAGERNPDTPFLAFSREVWEAPVAEAPVLGLLGSTDRLPNRLGVTVRRYRDQGDFLGALDGLAAIPPWAALARSSFGAAAEGTEEVAAFDAVLEKAGPFGEWAVRFPEPLPPGYYLVSGSAGDLKPQAWLQVTNLAAYASMSERATLVWVNDVATKGPVAGAEVAVAGGARVGSTGADGALLFDTPAGALGVADDALGRRVESAGHLVVTAGKATSVVPLGVTIGGASTFDFRAYEFAGDPGRFWRFVSTDRTLYRSTDTVNVWGFVRPREGSLPASEVVVRIGGYDEEGRPERVARATLPLSPAGTYLGRLALAGVSPGYYNLEASVGGQAVGSTSLEVRDFVTPAYVLDVTPSVPAAYAGDDVRYDITASFGEGTPVPGVRLNLPEPQPAEVTTDAGGRASVVRQAGAGRELYGAYNFDDLSVMPSDPEEGDIVGGARVRVFAAAVVTEAEGRLAGGTGVVSGVASAVDLAGAGRAEGAPDDFKAGPAAGRTVSAEVIQTEYRRVETGEYYDFVAKEVRTTYRYDSVQTPAGTFRATTGPDGRFEITFPASGERSYRVVLSTSDGEGRVYREETYLSSVFDYPDFTQLSVEDFGPHPLGSEVAVTLRHGAEPPPAGGTNRYLFLKAQNGIRSYTIGAEPRYAFPFAEADVPSVALAGVRFTGETYDEAIEPATVAFAEDSRRLTVEVVPGNRSTRRRPGEQVPLAVRVTDASGAGVEAEVLLSAVDEKLFRLQQDSFLGGLDILGDLYQPVPSGLLGSYAAHQRPARDGGTGGAEQGEGGDVRSDFRDAALFETVRTGPDGRATATFTLPDNLTSWRVSGLAVSGDLRAGSGAALVPVGLPVFVDVAAAASYLAGDRPVLRLRAFGDALVGGDDVTFSVESPTLLAAPLPARGKAFAPVDVPLPALAEGVHELTVRVEGKGQTDAVTRPLPVVASRLLRAEATESEVGPGTVWTPDPPAGSGPVRLTLADHNRGRYYPDLLRLSYTGGDRVDQALVRQLAGELLAEHYGDPPALPAAFRGSGYQTPNGGIAILPFADDDLGVTARLAVLASERFGRQGMAGYLQGIVDHRDETRERAAEALVGLAGLGEPVLLDVQALAAAADLEPSERLSVGLAAVALGDEDTARRLYRGLLDEFGQVRGATLRLNVGGDQDDVLVATSLAAALGARLADRFAPALYAYTMVNATTDVLVGLDQIAFLRAAVPRLAADPVRLSYSLDGRREEVTVKDGEAVPLRLTRDQLRTLELEVAGGTLGVAASALTPFDTATVTADPDLSVERTLPKSAGAGDLVRVTLRARIGGKAVAGCYRLTDLLPSGLRVVTQPYRLGVEDRDLDHPYLIEGQRVSFCVTKDATGPITYLARVTSPGSYRAEPVVLQAIRAPESIAFSDSAPIEIR